MAEVTCETFMTVVMEMPSSVWEGRGLIKAVAVLVWLGFGSPRWSACLRMCLMKGAEFSMVFGRLPKWW